MFKSSGLAAYKQLYENVRRKTYNTPSKSDPQYVDGGIFPLLRPDFRFEAQSKIFTIGSCFAREVEAVLLDCAFDVPVARFAIPADELALPGPHLLNEYNAGTIIQRLEAVAGTFEYRDKGIELTEKGALDLFLHVGSAPVSMERLLARREQIAVTYQELLTAKVVVITLGLVECWYDTVDDCYLNRAPSRKFIEREPERFEFHRMDVEDVFERVSGAISLLEGLGLKHVILTVSPVPTEVTFMPQSCPIANGYSKAVLRVCAEMLAKRHQSVTYFPSYEIANSFGTRGFKDDNVHVQEWVVHHIMHYMLRNFVDAP